METFKPLTMNNDNKTTRELALEWWNSWLTPEESLAQENKELKEENKLLREALQNLLGAFNTPIQRRRGITSFQQEALDIAEKIIT